jgi:hypothetical protein
MRTEEKRLMQTALFSLADFASSGWEKALDACTEKDIFQFSAAFRREAMLAENCGDAARAQLFYFLYGVASIGWEPRSAGNVFRPQCTFADGKRSLIPADYSDQEADLLRDLVPTISDPEMLARVSDVVWERKRDYKCAEIAIEAYLESAARLEDPENWSPAAMRLTRALKLARMLRNDKLMNAALSRIEAVLAKYNGADPLYFSANLMELLLEFRKGDSEKYVALAENASKTAETAHDWRRMRTYLQIKAKWLARAGRKADADSAIVASAETYVTEVNIQEASGSPNYMLVAHALECAIKLLRTIPGQTDRVQELYKRLLRVQSLTMSQLRSVEVPLEVPTESIEKARAAVAGKKFQEALIGLILLHQSPTVDWLKQQAREMAKLAPLSYSISTSHLTAAGSVAARTPGGTDPDEDDPALRSWMFRHADMLRTVVAPLIETARLQIVLEHGVGEQDWDEVVFNNPFIPIGRERLYARGLHSGLVGDFITAAHVLIPQLENSFREILANAGASVSTYNSEGVQRELYIYELLPTSKFKEIFGDAVTFDLRSLLVEQESANLRHGMTHGLYSSEAFQTPSSIYLWWLVLRLVCLGLKLRENGSPSSAAT